MVQSEDRSGVRSARLRSRSKIGIALLILAFTAFAVLAGLPDDLLLRYVLQPPEALPGSELVMPGFTKYVAESHDDTLTVTAQWGYSRTVEWHGCTFNSKMIPRQSRLLGNLGAYDPGPSSSTLPGCHGISRVIFEEGQLHIDDAAFVREWVERHQQGNAILTHDGVFVSWSVGQAGAQLNVSLWRICPHTEAPLSLPVDTGGELTITPDQKGQRIRACASASPEVIASTESTWRAVWAARQ